MGLCPVHIYDGSRKRLAKSTDYGVRRKELIPHAFATMNLCVCPLSLTNAFIRLLSYCKRKLILVYQDTLPLKVMMGR